MDTKRVAKLACLSLEEGDYEKLHDQFDVILKHFDSISEIDTEGVEPLITPVEIEYRFRKDEVENWETAEAAVSNAPEKQGNLFKVPPVV